MDPATHDLRNLVDGIAERLGPDELGTTRHGAEHLARYLFAAGWAPRRRVVDLCCGWGYGTNLLKAAGAEAARGVDIDAAAIDEATRRYGDNGVSFEQADVTEPLDLSDTTLRVCFEGLEHVPRVDDLLENMATPSAEGAIVIVSTPNGAGALSGGNPHHVHEYSLREFRELVSRYFLRPKFYFQWRFPDPHDYERSARSIARALVPVSLKSALRRPPGSPPVPTTGEALPPGLASEYRPLPLSYLRTALPGRRFGQPGIWIAVCEVPRATRDAA
jgi:2-polyprenyl-3-methyl-5-hydroxy-6-metoxy-1,4-benzoquinol methylase